MTLSDTPSLQGHLLPPGSTFIPIVHVQHLPWKSSFNTPPVISDTHQVVWKNLDLKVPCKAASLKAGHLDVELVDKTNGKIGAGNTLAGPVLTLFKPSPLILSNLPYHHPVLTFLCLAWPVLA